MPPALPIPPTLALACLAVPALDDGPPEPGAVYAAAVQRLDAGAAPVIDGVLDEPLWATARAIGPLVQVEPVEGAPPSQRTDVLLAYDDTTLYVGVRCWDDDVATLRATQRTRDARLEPDDSIELVLDPFLDRRNAFWFQVGPGGARGDALVVKNGSQFNKRWDGIWSGRATIGPDGWFAELAIPFATLNFREDVHTWGFNFRRYIRRHDEEARWASPHQNVSFYSIADAGTIAVLDGLDQGLGLDVAPFFVADWAADPLSGGGDGERHLLGDAGLDVFWRPSPDTKLSLSLNTDFAETEVDQQQVNLSRFSLFFPEKRDFFLEDSGNFFFGPSQGFGSSSDVLPFFSRRIGLDASGGEVPIDAALKLTGQTEDATFGLLDASTGSFTDEDGPVDAQNLFAGRWSRNLGEQSDAGLLFTAGDPDGLDTDAATLGLDWNWRTSDFLGDRNLRASAYVVGARNDPDGSVEDDLPLAYFLGVDYPNDELQLRATATVVEEAFDPALGYVRRPGTKKYSAQAAYEPRLDDHPFIKKYFWSIRPTLTTDGANHLESVSTRAEVFGVRFHSGDSVSLNVRQESEVLDEDFEILDGLVVPEDRYDTTRYEVWTRFAERRAVSGRLEFSTGDSWDGERRDYEARLDWRPAAWGSFRFEFERNELELGGGSFDVHTGRVRSDLSFTPDLSWSNDLQWDNVSEEVGFNSRLWCILGPGRELFLVLNQGWDAEGPGLVPTGTGLALKVGYTIRL